MVPDAASSRNRLFGQVAGVRPHTAGLGAQVHPGTIRSRKVSVADWHSVGATGTGISASERVSLVFDGVVYVTGPLRSIAKGAYTYSQGLRQALAIANLANSTESIIGMLPL